MKASGYNPLRWDCSIDGCFNKKKRPKIELFADCFPGKISFTDVDGIVEMNGRGLLLEWKPNAVELPKGQKIMYQNLTKNGILSVICLAGDAETMNVSFIAGVKNEKWYDWRPATLFDAQVLIYKWAQSASGPWHRWTRTELFNEMRQAIESKK